MQYEPFDEKTATPKDRAAWILCQMYKRIAELEQQLETERLKLAACSVTALSNTPESIKARIGRDNTYWSASYQDVCDAIDREMALREQNAALREDAERLDWAENQWTDGLHIEACGASPGGNAEPKKICTVYFGSKQTSEQTIRSAIDAARMKEAKSKR